MASKKTAADNASLADRVEALVEAIGNNSNEGMITQAQQHEADSIVAELRGEAQPDE